MTKIYVADDDVDIRRLLGIILNSEGYDVSTFETGDALYEEFVKEPSDLVILDVMMPGTDGLTICENLRKLSQVPIIMLTAKDTDADYIAGISLGSDDYITKPFNPTILVMRVRAILRREEMHKNTESKDIECGDLIYKVKERRVYKDDVEIEFTNIEFECLLYMMKHFNEAVSREDLLEHVWGYDKAVETRVTDETIRKIRKKIKLAGSRVQIKNKWGYGYILEVGVV